MWMPTNVDENILTIATWIGFIGVCLVACLCTAMIIIEKVRK